MIVAFSVNHHAMWLALPSHSSYLDILIVNNCGRDSGGKHCLDDGYRLW